MKGLGEGDRAISEEAASQVTSCMQTVVAEGTGVGGAVDGYDVAGKTGTAERADENGGYLKENYMSSFMGFAPAQSPKVLCYITLDGTPSGSDAAAVPFQSIMASALDVLVSRAPSRGLLSMKWPGRLIRVVHTPCTTRRRRWDTIRR